MSKRLFVGIPVLPSFSRSLLEKTGEIFGSLPVGSFRETEPELFHITVAHFGEQEDEMILPILEAINEVVAEEILPTEILWEQISYGPPGSKKDMVWLYGDKESSERIAEAQELLEDILFESRVPVTPSTHEAISHITLGRRNRDVTEELPELSVPFSKRMAVTELVLYESGVEDGVRSYFPLQRFPLY